MNQIYTQTHSYTSAQTHTYNITHNKTINNFWETPDKREILEKTGKYLIKCVEIMKKLLKFLGNIEKF